MRKATWINGKKTVTGYWSYNWNADYFFILLDKKDPITGRQREFKVYGEVPEWGKWKRLNTEGV